MKRLEHSALGFGLFMPDEWESEELPNGVVTVGEVPGDALTPPPGFAVTIEPLDGDWEPAALAEQGLLDEARTLTDLRLLDEQDVEVGGLPARRTLATYRQGVSSLTLEQWHGVRDGQAIVCTGLGPTIYYVVLHDVWHAMAGSLAFDGG